MEQLAAEIKTDAKPGIKIAWGLKEKLFVLVLISALAVFAGQCFEDTIRQVSPEQKVFRSVVNKKQSGLSALLSITSQSGLPGQLWLLPYRRLGEVKGLLYVVQPRLLWTKSEVNEILSWVKQGNELIYFDSFFHKQEKKTTCVKNPHTPKKLSDNILLRKLGLSLEWMDNETVIYNRHLPEMSHVKKLLLKAEAKIIGGQPVVGCKDGAYITSVKWGAGRIIVGSVPELCANEILSQKSNYDNFQFMINCFRTTNGGILFDEVCHGVTGEGNVFVYLSRRLPGLICLQLLFMFIPAELATRQRFGALKIVKEGRRISDLAYVFGLANVYKRAKANLAALDIIGGFWKTKLCRQLGLSGRASKEEILQRAKDSNIDKDGALSLFLDNYDQALSEPAISKTKLTQLVNECDSINIEVR